MSAGADGTGSSCVKVLFFAKARELAGLRETELALPSRLTSDELKLRLVKRFNLESIRDCFVLALNEAFVEPQEVLNLADRDEVAVIPPLSGGKYICDKMANQKDFVGLQTEKININDVIESVISPNCGAVSTFIGTTRDNFEQKKVLKLEYEAYEPMAVKELQAVCDKVRLQWNVEKIAIFHRLGEVPVTETSIIIAISSSHRQESLQAVQFAIDAVKTSVPIWKKEIYENEGSEWKQNKECLWTKNTKKKSDEMNAQTGDLHSEASNIIVDDEIDIDNVYETVEVESEFVNEDDNDESNTDANADAFAIDTDQVQIKASSEELKRRIESFIKQKREQVNMLNVQEFCSYSGEQSLDDDDDSTCVCARVNAILIKQNNSNSHVKVHRVYNQWSHQNIKPNKPIKEENCTSNYPPALEERLSTTEKLLGINKPVPPDVYARIKKIEDRLLFLEGISPEYKDLWTIDDCQSVKSSDELDDDRNIASNSVRKRTYSSAELDSKLNELEDRYGKKSKH